MVEPNLGVSPSYKKKIRLSLITLVQFCISLSVNRFLACRNTLNLSNLNKRCLIVQTKVKCVSSELEKHYSVPMMLIYLSLFKCFFIGFASIMSTFYQC